MKNPNGYGNISKLPGNRRKPWRVRKTVGWDLDEESGKTKQRYQTVGYFATRQEAMKALASFNENPYDINRAITFSELYEKWSNEKFETISDSNIKGYKASYSTCLSLYNMRFADIRKSHLQGVIDTCGKNYPTLRKIKVLFNQLFKYAMENDVCNKDYSEYVDIIKYKDKDKIEKHKPFSDKEIQMLWDNALRNDYIQIFLMLIYSGVRISEMLDLKKSDVHIDEQYFDIVKSKTEAGIRKVPIADKVKQFYKNWMIKNDSEYLISTIDGKHFNYNNYKDSYWLTLMKELSLEHLPHDTRHTTVSMLAKAGVNQTIIKRIVGHSGAMSLTEKVYTHFDIKQLVDAINLI